MKKILVIDDDEGIRSLLEDILILEGYQVITAADGREGMQKLEEFAPDLLVTDIIMPEREGIETIKSIRSSNQNLKIIAISGGVARSGFYLELAQKIGADSTIRKPFTKQKILAEVRDLLSGQS